MPACAHCGNEDSPTFQVTKDGVTASFDSFECAISRLAPVCEHCKVRIIGHVFEADGRVFCCEHCARRGGALIEEVDEALAARDELLDEAGAQVPAGVSGARARPRIAEGPASFPDGPNVEDSPWELEAARGHLPGEGR